MGIDECGDVERLLVGERARLVEGMLFRTNEAARSTRAMDAPTLKDLAPHNAGTTATPAPSAPWHRAQLFAKIALPRAVSLTSTVIFGMPSPGTWPPAGTPREMNARYEMMSTISRLCCGSARPARLRVKQ